jgi:hypothetical protein
MHPGQHYWNVPNSPLLRFGEAGIYWTPLVGGKGLALMINLLTLLTLQD